MDDRATAKKPDGEGGPTKTARRGAIAERIEAAMSKPRELGDFGARALRRQTDVKAANAKVDATKTARRRR